MKNNKTILNKKNIILTIILVLSIICVIVGIISPNSKVSFSSRYMSLIILGFVGIAVSLIILLEYNKNNIISTIIFWVSILPYIFVIGESISSAFMGARIFFGEYDGIEAFLTTLMLLSIVLSTFIPIIPLSITIQCIYISQHFKKKKNRKKFM